MSDIIDEVLNDTKDEKKILIFLKILPIIIVLTIICAIAMAYYSWYNNKTRLRNQNVGDILIDAISQDNDFANESLKKLVSEKLNKQTELAEIILVNNVIKSNNVKEAMTQLESIVDNVNYSEITVSYARMLWLGLFLDETNITKPIEAKAISYMEYFSQESQLFFANATLIKALFYKQNNQNDIAMKYAESILKLDNVSAIIKEQAKAIIGDLKNNLQHN